MSYALAGEEKHLFSELFINNMLNTESPPPNSVCIAVLSVQIKKYLITRNIVN